MFSFLSYKIDLLFPDTSIQQCLFEEWSLLMRDTLGSKENKHRYIEVFPLTGIDFTL